MAAYMRSNDMIAISERYRLKQFSLDATDGAIKAAWTEIAIEWHTLSNRAAQQYDKAHGSNVRPPCFAEDMPHWNRGLL